MAKTYTAVPSVSTGDVYTAANYNTYTATNVSNLIVPPMCQVRRTTNLTSYSSTAAIVWETASYDTDGMTASNSSTVTIQTSGIYNISLFITLSATATITVVGGFINKNGTAIAQQVMSAPQGTFHLFNQSMTADLTAGDLITASVSITGGSAYIINGSASETNGQSRLALAWIGRKS